MIIMEKRLNWKWWINKQQPNPYILFSIKFYGKSDGKAEKSEAKRRNF